MRAAAKRYPTVAINVLAKGYPICRYHRWMQQISCLNSAQTRQLVSWFNDLWWTQGRTFDDVARMLDHCIVVGFTDSDDKLIAFARVISDRVYKALVLDVIVDENHRCQGLGATLMNAVMAHPFVSGCSHFELYCAPELIVFYEQFGYTNQLGELTLMRAAHSSSTKPI